METFVFPDLFSTQKYSIKPNTAVKQITSVTQQTTFAKYINTENPYKLHEH